MCTFTVHKVLSYTLRVYLYVGIKGLVKFVCIVIIHAHLRLFHEYPKAERNGARAVIRRVRDVNS